jgi:hypothetical protein
MKGTKQSTDTKLGRLMCEWEERERKVTVEATARKIKFSINRVNNNNKMSHTRLLPNFFSLSSPKGICVCRLWNSLNTGRFYAVIRSLEWTECTELLILFFFEILSHLHRLKVSESFKIARPILSLNLARISWCLQAKHITARTIDY